MWLKIKGEHLEHGQGEMLRPDFVVNLGQVTSFSKYTTLSLQLKFVAANKEITLDFQNELVRDKYYNILYGALDPREVNYTIPYEPKEEEKANV